MLKLYNLKWVTIYLQSDTLLEVTHRNLLPYITPKNFEKLYHT